jgi:pyruvate dehydrogenase E1 component alpha subunit/2-oxoisovalerate dehydrogenase E1 component alpha subunit
MGGPGAGLPREGGILRVLGEDGRADPKTDPRLPEPLLRALFEGMVRARLLDERLAELQRSGRAGLHAGASGQEAVAVGAAAALEPSDLVFPGLRELGVLAYRGCPVEDLLLRCAGRPAGASLNVVSASACVGTQLPHAVGAAHAARLRGDLVVAAAFFGDGAVSTGDFHAALNLAGLWRVPAIFLCRSRAGAGPPAGSPQSASRTIAVKAAAYGLRGGRVDGGDVLAVYSAVRQAADRARRGEGPTLLELLLDGGEVRPGGDAGARPGEDGRGPIGRFRAHLTGAGLWSEEWEERVRGRFAARLEEAVRRVENLQPPPGARLFDGVWEELPPALREQREELEGGLEPPGDGRAPRGKTP